MNPFLDIPIRNVVPKFESSRLNAVAVRKDILTQPHTHILPNLGNTLTFFNFFAVIDNILTIMKLSPFLNYF